MIKTVEWNGEELHCVEWLVDGEVEWCFFGSEVVKVLGYDLSGKHSATEYTKKYCDEDEIIKVKAKEFKEKLNTLELGVFEIGRKGDELLLEVGVYSLILSSPMPKAKEFKKWVKQTIKQLREKSGLEQWELWRMLDKEHQKSVHDILVDVGDLDSGINCIRGNQNVNKIISCELFGFNKPLKKGEMEKHEKCMLIDRQEALQRYADFLLASNGSHTEAYELCTKWIKYKYKDLLD